MIRFEIKPPPPSLNKMLIMNHHARTRTKARFRKEIGAQICAQKVEHILPMQQVIIHAHRYAIRRLDGFDNYRASLKWVIDALTTKHNGLGIIQDDDDDHLTVGDISQVTVAHNKQERLVIVIVSLDPVIIEPQPDPGAK